MDKEGKVNQKEGKEEKEEKREKQWKGGKINGKRGKIYGKRGKMNGIQGKNDGKRGTNTKKHPKKFAGALCAPVYCFKKIAGALRAPGKKNDFWERGGGKKMIFLEYIYPCIYIKRVVLIAGYSWVGQCLQSQNRNVSLIRGLFYEM